MAVADRKRLRSGFAPSKFRAPAPRPDSLVRSALIDRLVGVADATCVTVSAGAGYGKTTLISQWLDVDRRPAAWVTLDGGDNDPVVLLRAVIAAIDLVEPLPESVVHVSDLFARETEILGALAEALTDRSPFVLVLDDVHVVVSDRSQRSITEIDAMLPHGSQIVLVGRSPTPFSRSSYRIAHHVEEFAQGDLAFEESESRAILTAAIPRLDTAYIDQLIERTEGWPAGIHLAVLALRDHDEPHILIEGLHGSDSVVAEYFRDELLTTLDHDLRAFLVHSSILERVCAELADAVLDQTGGAAILDEIGRSRNMFVFPLDHEQRWYRYHRLFGELLLSELRRSDPSVERTLRRRAALWCGANGEVEMAISQAIVADDLELAAELVFGQAIACVRSGRLVTIERWLDRFPERVRRRNGLLALTHCWLHLARGEAGEMYRWLAIADSSKFDGPLRDGTVDFELAKAIFRTTSGVAGTQATLAAAASVRNAGPDASEFWDLAVLVEAVCRYLCDEADDPVADLGEAEFASRGVPSVHCLALAHLALVHFDLGNDAAGQKAAEAAHEELMSNGLGEYAMTSMIHAVRAYAAARRNDPEASRASAEICERHLASLNSIAARPTIHRRLVIASAAFASGQFEAGKYQLERVELLLPLEPDARLLHRWHDRLTALRVVTKEALPANITRAELRVLELLGTHLSLGEIGARLYLSRNTVKSHSVSIYRKLGVSGRSEAVEKAVELGLLT